MIRCMSLGSTSALTPDLVPAQAVARPLLGDICFEIDNLYARTTSASPLLVYVVAQRLRLFTDKLALLLQLWLHGFAVQSPN